MGIILKTATHTHPKTHPSNDNDILIRIGVNNGRCLSLCFIIKAASQGESQGDTHRRRGGMKEKNGKGPDIENTVSTDCCPDINETRDKKKLTFRDP